MEKEKIIKENIERLRKISAVYNPITGEGSTAIPRQEVEIEGFPLESMHVPTSMLDDEKTAELIKKGANRFIEEKTGTAPTNKNILALWLNFCQTRIHHDLEIGRAHV